MKKYFRLGVSVLGTLLFAGAVTAQAEEDIIDVGNIAVSEADSASSDNIASYRITEYNGWPDIQNVQRISSDFIEVEPAPGYEFVIDGDADDYRIYEAADDGIVQHKVYEKIDGTEEYRIYVDGQEYRLVKHTLRLPRSTPYTDDEIDALLGDVPFYLDCGSFVLNRLNNIPPIHLSPDGIILRLDDKRYRVRPAWSELAKQIERRLSTYQGDWSVYVKDLSTGREIKINEHSMESASLIKLYIAGAIYESIEEKHLTMDEQIQNALNLMITISDNESSNVLVRRLCDETGDFQTGLAVVNDFIDRTGFVNTEQINGIADPSLWVSDGRVNQTSAADCGRFLEMVYRGELVSHYTSFLLESLLNRQEINYKIPDGLPQGTHISHKTGEVDDTENDAAIVYTPFGDYIFCILSNGLTDTNAAVANIHQITALVHRYFTEPIIEITKEGNDVSALGENLEAESPAE